jgi:hypothetical protein
MDLRYIFAVQCQNTHIWWLWPPTSSLEELIHCKSFVVFSFLFLIWEGTWVGFSMISCILELQVPRTTPCLSSIVSPSHPETFSSCTQVLSRHKFPEQRSSRSDYPGHFWAGLSGGWNIRSKFGPDNPVLRFVHIKEGGRGELPTLAVLPPPTPSLSIIAACSFSSSPVPPRPPDPADLQALCFPSPREQVPPSSSSNG